MHFFYTIKIDVQEKKASNHAVNCYIKHQWLNCSEKGNNIEEFYSL